LGLHLTGHILIVIIIYRVLIGVSSKKLESWLDKQDEDMNELREELKKERKQQENMLRVSSVFSFIHFIHSPISFTLLST